MPSAPARTTSQAGAAGWIAVFAPPSLAKSEVEDRIASAFGGCGPRDRLVRLSVSGTSLDLGDLTSDNLHVLAGLDDRFKRAAILTDAPVLYATEAVFCWLGSLLRDMGPGAELWIDIANPRANLRHGRVTPDALRQRFAGLTVSGSGQWTVLKSPQSVAAEPPPSHTIYRFLNRFSSEYAAWYIADCLGDWSEEKKRSAIGTYIYSLQGLFYRDFLVERVCRWQGLSGDKRLLDVGGGLGFFAAERAAHGDQVAILDKNPRYLATARRLFAHCGVAERVAILQMPMETLHDAAGKYDVIVFFNSLLYARKDAVPQILGSAFELLNPGGVAILLENSKEAGDVNAGYNEYDVRFSLPAFLRLLQPFGQRVAYWNVMTGTPIAAPREASQLAVSIAKPK